MISIARVGLAHQTSVKPPLICASFVSSDQQDCPSTRIEGERDPPYAAIGVEPELLHIRVLRVTKRVHFRPAKLRTVLAQSVEPVEHGASNRCWEARKLSSEHGVELHLPRHASTMTRQPYSVKNLRSYSRTQALLRAPQLATRKGTQ